MRVPRLKILRVCPGPGSGHCGAGSGLSPRGLVVPEVRVAESDRRSGAITLAGHRSGVAWNAAD